MELTTSLNVSGISTGKMATSAAISRQKVTAGSVRRDGAAKTPVLTAKTPPSRSAAVPRSDKTGLKVEKPRKKPSACVMEIYPT